MRPVLRHSVAELAAAHLRDGLRAGRWSGRMPGVARLAAELDVAPATLRAALRLLETEGLLSARGLGRSRVIAAPGGAKASLRKLRVGILPHDVPLAQQDKTDHMLLVVQHELEAAGHTAFFTNRSQTEFHHNVQQIVRHLPESTVDAWIVVSGSRELLEWFATQEVPTIALYGRSQDLPIARTGPDKVPSMIAATRHLIGLGHRRIVLITVRARRTPIPGNVEQAFLDELRDHGISTSAYNLPAWDETPEGLYVLLESLFRMTPPTALIIEETPRVVAALHYFAERGIRVPEHVSLVSADYDPSLAWSHRVIAHMEWNNAPIIRRIVRWVAAVRQGRADRKTINYPAEFIPGDSLGPARKG